MASIGWPEILIILAIVLLLFGANKLPDLARSMGRSARIFKSEVKEMRNDDKTPEPPAQPELTAQTEQPAQAAESFWDRPENQPRPQN